MAESLYSIYSQWLCYLPAGEIPLSFEDWKAQQQRKHESQRSKSSAWNELTRHRAEQQLAKTVADRQQDKFDSAV